MLTIPQLLERAETCHREVATEYFNAFSGRQERLDVVPIMERYPELFSRETYELVTSLGADEMPDERERRFLKHIFTVNYISDRLKVQNERLANAEGDAMVEVDGGTVPYRVLPAKLGNEPGYDLRGRMDEAYLKVLDSLNPLREEIDGISESLVRELGYNSTIEFCEKLARMRIYPLRELTQAFLAGTDELYEKRLGEYAAKADGLTRDKLRHADISFMMRAHRYDGLFPPEEMVGALSRTLKGLGIELEAQRNVTLDLDVRPKKSPRAFCIGIDAPRDVRLVLMPRGGRDDFSTFFHEAGHLEFGAHMGEETPYIYRRYGDTSVHESYAFLLQHLVDDEVWWREIMGREPVLPSGESYPAFARFNRLYMFRRYSAKLAYEIEYYEKGGGRALAPAYARWLSRGTGVAYPEVRYLADFDGGFYVLQYLQAWIWEVQLRSYLKREFGETWFLSRQAGGFLRGLWQEGMKYDIWEIAEHLGLGGLDIAPLTAELTR